MQETEGLTLVCLVRVTPQQLPPKATLGNLPELLDAAITSLAPKGLDPSNYFLVPGDYWEIRSAVNELAAPYHSYAVDVCGERCTQDDCAEHVSHENVIPFSRRVLA